MLTYIPPKLMSSASTESIKKRILDAYKAYDPWSDEIDVKYTAETAPNIETLVLWCPGLSQPVHEELDPADTLVSIAREGGRYSSNT